MTKRTGSKAKAGAVLKPEPDDGLMEPGEKPRIDVEQRTDEKIGKSLARVTLDPQTRNAHLAMAFGSNVFGDSLKPDLMQSSAVLADEIAITGKGDLGLANRIFTSQAITLDAMFTEMARRAAENMGSYPQAVERYTRLALKAQANCRATLEALVRLHQPREQIVKHVHVNEGGQAVVADHFHTGGGENGKSVKQSDATGAAGASPALPSPDPFGKGVPIPSREGPEAVPYAWGHEPGSAEGQ